VVWPASSSAAHDPAAKFTPWAGGRALHSSTSQLNNLSRFRH